MSTRSVRLVLVLDDAGYRSMLAARLAMSGAEVMSALGFDEPGGLACERSQCVLVTDVGAAAQFPGGAMSLSDQAHWARVILIVDGPPASPEGDARLIRIERQNAIAAIAAVVQGLR